MVDPPSVIGYRCRYCSSYCLTSYCGVWRQHQDLAYSNCYYELVSIISSQPGILGSLDTVLKRAKLLPAAYINNTRCLGSCKGHWNEVARRMTRQCGTWACMRRYPAITKLMEKMKGTEGLEHVTDLALWMLTIGDLSEGLKPQLKNVGAALKPYLRNSPKL